jgi:hypothetical protein
MAIKTNTYTTYSVKGMREDLSDIISNISPEDTVFMSNVGKTDVKNTYFEWQQDALASVDTANAQLEGDDVDSGTLQAATATTRIGNYVQISRKTAIVSGTMEATDRAGRNKEMAYQMSKRSAELKRDMESIALSNQAAVAGNTTTARKTGSLLAFLKTNVNSQSGNGGADPSYTTVPNDTRDDDGTPVAFTETILKNVIQQVWASGGTPKIVQMGPVNKQKASAFTGIASQRFNVQGAKPSTIIGSADIYVSDFGNVSFVCSRFQRERDVFVLDPEYIKFAYLRPFHQVQLAKTGDAEKRVIQVEWGLQVVNEAALGLAADLTTS